MTTERRDDPDALAAEARRIRRMIVDVVVGVIVVGLIVGGIVLYRRSQDQERARLEERLDCILKVGIENEELCGEGPVP